MNPARTRVLCVDDSEDVVTMYARLIARETDMECVGCLCSADRLVEEARRLKADVVLLDLTMPGKNPLEACAELTAASPATRTIVVSGYDDAGTRDQAMWAGASLMVSKNRSPDVVIEAVRTCVKMSGEAADEPGVGPRGQG